MDKGLYKVKVLIDDTDTKEYYVVAESIRYVDQALRGEINRYYNYANFVILELSLVCSTDDTLVIGED